MLRDEGPESFTVKHADQLASEAHAGQVDKLGVPYIEHVRVVAAGVAQFGTELEKIGLLHDIMEDTPWTADALREAGVPDEVVYAVDTLTRRPGESYMDYLEAVATVETATLVKIADNAHNSQHVRLRALPLDVRKRLERKYSAARDVLWRRVDKDEVRRILRVVNTDLLHHPDLR